MDIRSARGPLEYPDGKPRFGFSLEAYFKAVAATCLATAVLALALLLFALMTATPLLGTLSMLGLIALGWIISLVVVFVFAVMIFLPATMLGVWFARKCGLHSVGDFRLLGALSGAATGETAMLLSFIFRWPFDETTGLGNASMLVVLAILGAIGGQLYRGFDLQSYSQSESAN